MSSCRGAIQLSPARVISRRFDSRHRGSPADQNPADQRSRASRQADHRERSHQDPAIAAGKLFVSGLSCALVDTDLTHQTEGDEEQDADRSRPSLAPPLHCHVHISLGSLLLKSPPDFLVAEDGDTRSIGPIEPRAEVVQRCPALFQLSSGALAAESPWGCAGRRLTLQLLSGPCFLTRRHGAG